MQALRRLALITTILTLLLIAVGASVRAAGAGLGCRDWPECFEGHWLPPSDASTLSVEDAREYSFRLAWIEYANRLVGVLIGFFILGTCVLAWIRARARVGVVLMLTAAALLTGFQGWQGGKVVQYELDPRWVTVHLATALVILVLLARATIDLYGRDWRSFAAPLAAARSRVRGMARAALFLVVTQVILGALVRGTVDLVANETPDLPREGRLAEVGSIDMIHRQMGALAWFVIAGLTVLVWRHRAVLGRGVSRWGGAAFLLGSSQIAFGLGLAYGGLPPALQVLHIASACALVVALDATQRFAGGELAPLEGSGGGDE